MMSDNISVSEVRAKRDIQATFINYYAGIALLVLSVSIVIYTVFRLFNPRDYPTESGPDVQNEPALIGWVMSNAPAVFSAIFAYVFFSAGLKLISTAQSKTDSVIPKDDFELIKDRIKDNSSVDEYIKVRSLHGLTGFFTKIGLTGLPLTMVILTLVFAALHIGYELEVQDGNPQAFLDLTKLTLGAFIGSYVQKGQDINFQWFQSLIDRNQNPPASK